jgi:GrpB-like predicted nucleotidyltransferase (UPF0157 family)
MTDQESLHAAIQEHVELVPYDPAWPRVFELERARLRLQMPDTFRAIEHIGSTAVPQLSAKPIVDILAGVASLESVDDLTARLSVAGYTTSAEFNASLSDRKWFMRWRNGRRTHHLHVVVHDGQAWRERLAFRDRLRVDPDAAAQYQELKAALALEHRNDREAYTGAKRNFVELLLAGRL